jgi:hypothetical protein
LVERASKKPCPWCGNVAGFRTSDENLLIGLAKAHLRFAGELLTRPHRLLQVITSGSGIAQMCVSCKQGVLICPHCDTPNRENGLLARCVSCAAWFSS